MTAQIKALIRAGLFVLRFVWLLWQALREVAPQVSFEIWGTVCICSNTSGRFAYGYALYAQQ